MQSKKGAGHTAAGCFTQPWTTALVLDALKEAMKNGWIKEKDVTHHAIQGFLSGYGRAFYGVPESRETSRSTIRLEQNAEIIPELVTSHDRMIEVVPFRRGKPILTTYWNDENPSG